MQDLSVTAARDRHVMPMSSLRPITVVSQILSTEHQTMVKLQLRLFSIIWRCCGKSLRANQAHEFLDQALDGSEVAISMVVGSGYTSRAVCDGLSLSSPGRWAPHARKYPTTEHWREVSGLFMDFARRHGSADLLMKFALGKVEESPFGTEAISTLKSRVIESLSRWG